jgi:hypothetical protein
LHCAERTIPETTSVAAFAFFSRKLARCGEFGLKYGPAVWRSVMVPQVNGCAATSAANGAAIPAISSFRRVIISTP